jgi:hypothetical protein
MDPGIVAALAMLVVWGIGTFGFEAPGWIHGLLSLGVFLLIYRIVVRSTPKNSPEAKVQGPEGKKPENRKQKGER